MINPTNVAIIDKISDFFKSNTSASFRLSIVLVRRKKREYDHHIRPIVLWLDSFLESVTISFIETVWSFCISSSDALG